MARGTTGWRGALIGGLAVAVVAGALLGLAVGPVALSPGRVVAALAGGGDAVARAIVIDLRLPRTGLALIVGAMLGLGGAAAQGYLRNPLADPAILGTANAAALGAVVALYFGLYAAAPLALPLLAIAGALASLLLLFALGGRGEGALALILAGIAVSTLAGASISLALNLSPNPFAAMEIMNWLMGSLENRSFDHVWLALPCIAAGMALLFHDARALDALTLGEDSARASGFVLGRVRLRIALGLAIGVGGAVAVAGAIGFIGLIVPHLVRPFTDRAPSSVLLPSAIGGAALLLFADVAVRVIPTTAELRLGVVTAVLGVPVFLWQLRRSRQSW